MTKNKKKLLLILLIFLMTLIIIRVNNNYPEITSKPKKEAIHRIIPTDTSLISLNLNLNYKSIEAKINEGFKVPIIENGKGEFKNKYQFKTKNILYDPSEWIKTKDPLYNPKRMIKIFGGKTKNPFYHPRKWIKTKNPKYNPNKWIYGKVADVTIGYNYKYEIKKNDSIKFENINNNRIRINVPLDIEGSFGFRGDGAKLLSLTKKKFKAKINIIIDSQMYLDTDGCIKPSITLNHRWISDPKLEIIDGLWFDIRVPSDIAILELKNIIAKEFQAKLDCKSMRKQITELTKPLSIPLENDYKKIFLNIKPINIYSSDLYLNDSLINLKVSTKLILNVSSKKLDDKKSDNIIEKIEKYNFERDSIIIKVPVIIGYSEIENKLNKEIKKKKFNFKNKNIEVKKIEIYPSGERITIGVSFKAKINGNFFDTKGTIYLTAKPIITKEKVFELNDITFSTMLDNEVYPLLGSVFKNQIISIIYKETRKDIKPDLINAEKLITEGLKNQLKSNNLSIEFNKIETKLFGIIPHKDELVITVGLSTNGKLYVK